MILRCPKCDVIRAWDKCSKPGPCQCGRKLWDVILYPSVRQSKLEQVPDTRASILNILKPNR